MSDPSSLPGNYGPPPVVDDSTLTGGTKSSKSVTKRDVNELLASFEPEAPKSESPAEKERARRIARLENGVRTLAKNLEEWGVTDGIPADAAAALKALKTVLSKGTSAISSLSDAKLGMTAATPKTTRAPKPVETTPQQGAPETAADLHYGDEGQMAEPSETPEQMDSRLAAERAERGAPTRSGPPAAAAPTGSTEEGF